MVKRLRSRLSRLRKGVKQEEKLSSAAISMHVLDLRQGDGFLRQRHVDFPHHSPSPQQYYLRRKERWMIPPSYRTGMVFFTSVMVLGMLSITGISAYGSADSRQAFLGAQILQEFSNLSQELDTFAAQDSEKVAADTVTVGVEALAALEPEVVVFPEDPLSKVLQSSESYEHSELLRLGLDVSKGYQAFQRFMETWNNEQELVVLEKFRWMQRAAEKALALWDDALNRSQQLTLAAFSPEKQQQFQQTLQVIADLSGFLFAFNSGFDVILHSLGADEPQRLLVLIQDDNQRRATGGALSAGVEILLENGNILAWRPFHVSEYDDLLRIQLQTPLGLGEISDRWNLATANSFLDGQRSAEQVHWFWQREARSSVDMVVFVTTSALEQFFIESGGIDILSSLDRSQIENMSLKWSAWNLQNDREQLKTTASQLIEGVVEVFADPQATLQAWNVIQELASKKQVLFSSTHPDLQAQLQDFGLSGNLPTLAEKEDLLLVSRVNTANNGTDRWIDESYRLDTSIDLDGTIQHWLKIHRQNTWQAAYQSGLRDQLAGAANNTTLRQLSSAKHSSMMKIVVPKGSRLTNVDGVPRSEVTEFASEDFTVWTFPSELEAGQGTEFALSYTLPWTFDVDAVDNYRLRLIKQAGAEAAHFDHHFKLPAQLTIFQQLPEAPFNRLERDQTIAVVAGRNP